MGLDTRFRQRWPINAEAEYKVHEAMDGDVQLNIPSPRVKCRLIDVSLLGCSLDSPYLIPHKTLLDITIDATPLAVTADTPARSSIRFVGRVTSCTLKSVNRYRLGISFMDIREEDLAFIESYINKKS